MTTVCVVLSEKVDTTLSKGVLRILCTVAGGASGARMAKLQTKHVSSLSISASDGTSAVLQMLVIYRGLWSGVDLRRTSTGSNPRYDKGRL